MEQAAQKTVFTATDYLVWESGQLERHEFLDGKRVQRTIYSDGTTVTADFQKGTWTIGSLNND